LQKKTRMVFASILIFLLSCYCSISLVIYFKQASYIYLPSKKIETLPDHHHIDYENVYFTSSDNNKLNGWFIEADNAQATVLFCHGNAGNISILIETIEILKNLNLNVLVFDYRGYGLSEGAPTEEGTYSDAKAAYDYLTKTKNISPSKLIIFGRSLGGPIASWLAQQFPPKAIILESTFTSMLDMAHRRFPYIPAKMMVRYTYPTETYVKNFTKPTLIIHSSEDELIPYSMGQKLYDNITTTKVIAEIHGDHGNGFFTSGQEYIDCLRKFLSDQKLI